ncbi:MAG: hypothetical protein QOD75_622 [Blastocatellia bacterium]|nr:hypothetical protein [Blastocatellia bacterium]
MRRVRATRLRYDQLSSTLTPLTPISCQEIEAKMKLNEPGILLAPIS